MDLLEDDSFIDQLVNENIEKERSQQKEKTNVIINSNVNAPFEENASIAENAHKAKMPYGVAKELPEEAKKEADKNHINSLNLQETSPILSNQLTTDERFAETSLDDLKALANTEKVIKEESGLYDKAVGLAKFFNPFSADYVNSFTSAWVQTQEMDDLLTKQLRSGSLTDDETKRLQYLQNYSQSLESSGNNFFTNLSSLAGSVVGLSAQEEVLAATAGGAAAGTLLAGVGAAPAGLAAYEAAMYVNLSNMYAAQAYDRMIKQGIDRDDALPLAYAEGASLGLMDIFAAKSLRGSKEVFHTSRQLATEEAAKRLVSPLAKRKIKQAIEDKAVATVKLLAYDQGKRIASEVSNETGLALSGKESNLATPEGRAGVYERLVGDPAERVGHAFTLGVFAKRQRLALDGVDSRTYWEATKEQEANTLKKIEDANSASKTKERSPAVNESFIEKQIEDKPVKNTYVKTTELADALEEHGISVDELGEIVPDIREQFNSTANTGGDVVIPLSTYLARIADTKIGEAIKSLVRLSPSRVDSTTVTDVTVENARKALEEREIEVNNSNSQVLVATDNHITQNFPSFSKAIKDYNASLTQSLITGRAIQSGNLPHEALNESVNKGITKLNTNLDILKKDVDFIDFTQNLLDFYLHNSTEMFGIQRPELDSWFKEILGENQTPEARVKALAEAYEKHLFSSTVDPRLKNLFKDYSYFLASLESSGITSKSKTTLSIIDSITEAIEYIETKAPDFEFLDEANPALQTKYKELSEQAKWEAVETIMKANLQQMQWLNNGNSRTLKRLQKNHFSLREAERKRQLGAAKRRKIYKGIKELQGNVRISKKSLSDYLKNELDVDHGTSARLMESMGRTGHNIVTTRDFGIPFELSTSIAGYKSPEAFLVAIKDTLPIDLFVERKTDEAMLQKHGKLNTDNDVTSLLNKATYNKKYQELNTLQLKSLLKLKNSTANIKASLDKIASTNVGNIKMSELMPKHDYYKNLLEKNKKELHNANLSGDVDAMIKARRSFDTTSKTLKMLRRMLNCD
jgi:hypothetical protein